ncbi:putative RING-H2 finger protein ATL71 [Cynara cardunculus var. scolymus]|uniref:Zinc finger, RING/FYVE/PHD-type n=1 Tax=Cynara cardunculus var. scolymus TaxID=59895 RepID=A0A103YIC0_CYNCS|nr:putative RING-H2 finger protein ATL71 [Cynara cardunculus var. scolymus]KVI09624.1 Zinc finger, RING/FYVE/PHD-type [Cynara cardunculus var. scolymus]
MDAGEPSYTGDDIQNTEGGIVYGLGFYFLLLLLIFTLCYTSYICKRSMLSRSPPPSTTIDDYHFVRLSHGLDGDILATFPTFLYSDSEIVMLHKGTGIDNNNENNYGSDCCICLANYRPADVLRLLPECGHFFHANCIDTWLKVHPTCPVCRISLDLTDE